jgi:hypothetical protein
LPACGAGSIDYDALASDLTQRGWTLADMQLFSDERALGHAGAAKVCEMVKDWFAALLGIKDTDMQLRLLVDSVKPVVGWLQNLARTLL